MENNEMIKIERVQSLIIHLRDQEVILDRDVAELYGVETKRINEAVRNNPDKFPDRYCFTLQSAEKQYVVENFDRMKSLKKSTVEPKAFTESGLYMLATIIKSKVATATTISIIDAFTKLRELNRNFNAIHHETDQDKKEGLLNKTGELLNGILQDDEETTETESTIELNLMALKLKHSVKKITKKK